MSDYWEDILNSSSAVPRMRGVLHREIWGRCPKDGGVKNSIATLL